MMTDGLLMRLGDPEDNSVERKPAYSSCKSLARPNSAAAGDGGQRLAFHFARRA